RDWWHPSHYAGWHAVIVMDASRPRRMQVELKLVARCFERVGTPVRVSIPVGPHGAAKSFSLLDAWGYRGEPIAQPYQLQPLPVEIDEELSAGEIAVSRLASVRHAIALGELGVGEARVTHHERALRSPGDDSPEQSPERAGLAEAAHAAKTGVARDAAPPQ